MREGQLQRTSAIVSDYTGRVLELTVTVGQRVPPVVTLLLQLPPSPHMPVIAATSTARMIQRMLLFHMG